MKFIYPPKLKKGSKIGIIATSSSVSTLDESQIRKGYQYLENKGFKIVEHPQCRLQTGYTAGSIKKRVGAIHQFVADKEIDCIMSFWGGYNTNQILDYLDYQLIKKCPKIFIGYSDTCALLQAITAKTGIVTYMGPAVISFTKPDPFDYTWEYFERMCIDNSHEVSIKDSKNFADDLYFLRKDNNHRIIQKNMGTKIFRGGKTQGTVMVSNLSTLLILLNTPYLVSFKDKILFIEEAEDSNCQMIHRMMVQLKQAGIIGSIKGLVLGKFMDESKINEKQLLLILGEIIEDIKIPVVYNSNFGHTDPIFTIPNGGECQLNADSKNIIFS